MRAILNDNSASRNPKEDDVLRPSRADSIAVLFTKEAGAPNDPVDMDALMKLCIGRIEMMRLSEEGFRRSGMDVGLFFAYGVRLKQDLEQVLEAASPADKQKLLTQLDALEVHCFNHAVNENTHNVVSGLRQYAVQSVEGYVRTRRP